MQKIYYINLPVGCGVSHKIADEIASDKKNKCFRSVCF